MFWPSLRHPQALKENRSKITYMFYKHALWDPKNSQNLQTHVFYNLYCISITFCELEVILTVHRRYYVQIKCQLIATDDIYCRSYCLLNVFRAPLSPSSGAREYYTGVRCLWYLVLWFSSCRYGVELRVMCLVCSLHTTGSDHLYNTLELLTMGIMVPETCWASNKICNNYHLLHLVGILFPHIVFSMFSPTRTQLWHFLITVAAKSQFIYLSVVFLITLSTFWIT